MAILKITGFLGENRALHPKKLDDGVGVVSRNQKPGRGDFRAWRVPLTVATVPASRATIYRMGRDVASDSNYWLSWPTKVHAVRGFDAADTSERTYYTGDGIPKVTDNVMALSSAPYPTTNRPMSLPSPSGAPAVSANSGTWLGLDGSYYYTYTYVNDWGWESAPSPPSAVLVRKTDQTSTLSGFSAPPSGNYQINRIRIYRTQTGTSGATDFYFLAEVAIGTASAIDSNPSLGETLPSAAWLAAPDDLHHLVGLWNGMLAGISGNGIRFCEPYTPYAWPIGYEVVPPDSKPVALGYFGQSLLVLTTGRPILLSGSSPESMDQNPLEIPQGCIAAKSVVSMGSGVAWAAMDGLCWYGVGGAKIVTAGLMTREDWQALVPSSIIGQMYEGLYFGSYDDGTGRKGFFIDPMSPSGIYFMDTGYTAMHFDELQDQLYVLNGASVQRWDAGASYLTAKFRSKVFQLPAATSMSCADVVADSYPVTLRVDAVGLTPAEVANHIAQNPMLTAPTAQSLRYSVIVPSRQSIRLPSGFRALDWQIEIEGASSVQEVNMATTMQELAGT